MEREPTCSANGAKPFLSDHESRVIFGDSTAGRVASINASRNRIHLNRVAIGRAFDWRGAEAGISMEEIRLLCLARVGKTEAKESGDQGNAGSRKIEPVRSKPPENQAGEDGAHCSSERSDGSKRANRPTLFVLRRE